MHQPDATAMALIEIPVWGDKTITLAAVRRVGPDDFVANAGTPGSFTITPEPHFWPVSEYPAWGSKDLRRLRITVPVALIEGHELSVHFVREPGDPLGHGYPVAALPAKNEPAPPVVIVQSPGTVVRL